MLKVTSLFLLLLVSACGCSTVTNVDLGYEVNEDSMHWLNAMPFSRQTIHNGSTDDGYWYETYNFCSSEHLGTHLDAPSHFAKGKWTVTDIPLERLMTGQGVVVDIRDKVEKDSAAELTPDDLVAWMERHGALPDGAVVFVFTGWGSRYGNKTAYFGTATNDVTKLVFPGISPSAAQLLAGYEQATGRRVFGVGIDTASLDYGPSTDFKAHISILHANIYGLENVANLEKLPTRGFEVIVLPLKLTKGSGAPTRLVARIPGNTSTAMTSSSPCQNLLLILAAFNVLFNLL